MTGPELFEQAAGKRVLFLTTKNADYIRNTQEIALLSEKAKSVTVWGFADKGYLKRLAKLYAQLLFRTVRPYDLVFVGFAPQLVLPFFYPKLKSKAIWADFFISMYDTLVCDRKKFAPHSPAARLLHWLDRRTLSRAGRLVADTAAHAAYFVKKFGADPQRVSVLYLQADRSVYFPREAAKPEGLRDKFLVLYFGSILPLQGVEIILACAEMMRNEPGVFFDIIGPVPAQTLARYQGLKNVRFTPWLSQPQLAGHIAAADLCLAGHFNANIDKASRTIPGKAYIYEAMQKPMILGDNAANHEYFTADTRHVFVQMGDPAGLRTAILAVRRGCAEQPAPEIPHDGRDTL